MKKTVLLVDDDPMILAALKNTLKKHENDMSVFVADDGLAAVEILKEKPISLVVTDLKMPRMDGLSLLAYILENKPSTPCIVMTAYSTKELEELFETLKNSDNVIETIENFRKVDAAWIYYINLDSYLE